MRGDDIFSSRMSHDLAKGRSNVGDLPGDIFRSQMSQDLGRGRQATFAPGPPERIPSFKTDVESPTALTSDRLAAHDRLDSFASEMSSSARPYPPPPPFPGSSPASSMFGSAGRQGANNIPLGVTCAPFKATPGPLCEERPCDQWTEGTVVEAFSASADCWYPAQISKIEMQSSVEDVLTVVFYVNDEMKQKSVHRSDVALAPLSTHTFGDLPPGFETRPSQSKPGQLVYLDATTGTKYASLQLAWKLHFERLKQQPVGCATVACVPRGQDASSVQSEPISALPSPLKAFTLAELGQGPGPLPSEPDDSPGKIALPSFNDNMGSQAAYLGYMGTPGEALAASRAEAASGYQAVNASAPKRPIRTREVNPALQVWQEDAFSEWRR